MTFGYAEDSTWAESIGASRPQPGMVLWFYYINASLRHSDPTTRQRMFR